jgi:error-prone DNA polymerase
VPAATVELVGQMVVLQSPPTAKGVWFLTLSDETSLINVVVSPAIYARDRAAIQGNALVWLRGAVQRRQSMIMLQAAWIRPLALLIDNRVDRQAESLR